MIYIRKTKIYIYSCHKGLTETKYKQNPNQTTFTVTKVHRCKGITYVQKCTCLDACSILINIMKFPATSKRKPPVCNFRGSVCVQVTIFIRVTVRRRVRRALHDLYCRYFLPKVMLKFMRKAKGHCVSITEMVFSVLLIRQ